MTTETYIDVLVDALRPALQAPCRTADEFVLLTSAGEPLRRVAEVTLLAAEHRAVLERYEAALTAYEGPIPDHLVDDMVSTAHDLVVFAAQPVDARDPDDGRSLLLELDAITSAIVAAERTGRLGAGTAAAASARIEAEMRDVSGRSAGLAQAAEDRRLAMGDDPSVHGAFGWLDALASGAASRLAVGAAVASQARRERRIEKALAALARPRPRQRAKAILDQLLPAFRIPSFAHQPSFSGDAVAMPDHFVLVEDDELAIYIERRNLVIVFASALPLDDVAASVDGGSLAAKHVEEREFRFELPDTGRRLRLSFRVDGELMERDVDLQGPP